MSAIDDNKTFLTSVIGAGNVDFENHVYGLWVSVFENLNHSTNGYSYPTPIINDLLSIDYAITGKTFSVFNTDGRKPDVKFFITSGVISIPGRNSNILFCLFCALLLELILIFNPLLK